MIQAKWKNGYGFFKADAQLVAEEILEIGDDVHAEDILDKARNEDTELHKCFEWDDGIAAEKYRLQQARDIVKLLVIREESEPVDRPEIRLFYKTDQQEGYKPTKIIVKKEDEYRLLLERAYGELRAFKAKYSMLTELQEIFDLIN